MTKKLKVPSSKESGSLKTSGPNGRARRRETPDTFLRQALIQRQNALPRELSLPPARKKKVRNFYRVDVPHSPEATVPLKVVIGELEKKVIVDVLSEVNGNQKDAARILGMKYTTLNEKVKRYQIRVRRISIIE